MRKPRRFWPTRERRSGFTVTATGWSVCARSSAGSSTGWPAIRSRRISSLPTAPSVPPTATTSWSTTERPVSFSRLKPRRKRKGRRRQVWRGDLQRDHLVTLEDDGARISRVNLRSAPIVHVDDELLVGREREL